MSESDKAQPLPGRETLRKIDEESPEHFRKIKKRLVQFFDRQIDEGTDLGQTKEEIQELFNPEGPPFQMEELRLAKALTPSSISKSEDIEEWVPLEIRKHLEQQIDSPEEDRDEKYFAYCVILGLLQIFQPKGLKGARHPDNSVRIYGGGPRKDHEEKLSQLLGYDFYPWYTVVEKQVSDDGYIDSVGKYGNSLYHPELGIMCVLVLKNRLIKDSVFYFGDSARYLTWKERKYAENNARKTSEFDLLRNMAVSGDIDEAEQQRLDRLISENIFPDDNFEYKSEIKGGKVELKLSPVGESWQDNLIGLSELLSALDLSKKLKSKRLLDDHEDYIEAQNAKTLRPDDCEAIFINTSILQYLDDILSKMPENIREEYNRLLNNGVIKLHQKQ